MNISSIENATIVVNGNALDWLTLDRIGIIAGIILGGFALFFKLKGWNTAKEANKIAKAANTFAKEANEISKNLQKKQHDHDKKVAKEQIIKHLKRFIDTEGKEAYNKIGDRHQEKITEIRNDFKNALMVIDNDRIWLPQNILAELLEFTDKIAVLSEQKLRSLEMHGRESKAEKEQIQRREYRGNKCVEEATEFVTRLEK